MASSRPHKSRSLSTPHSRHGNHIYAVPPLAAQRQALSRRAPSRTASASAASPRVHASLSGSHISASGHVSTMVMSRTPVSSSSSSSTILVPRPLLARDKTAKRATARDDDFVEPLSALKAAKRKLPWDNKPAASGAKRSRDLHAASRLPLSSDQEDVFDLVVNHHKSVFFTGSAGTGKSYLLRRIIQALRDQHAGSSSSTVVVTAPTGIAACNIGGCTVHTFAGIGLGQGTLPQLYQKVLKNRSALKRWQECRTLVIDEISMVDGELFDKLEGLARQLRNSTKPFGGIQLVISGDFFQLPPVSKDREFKFAFEAKSWSKCVPNTIMLSRIYRQKDTSFVQLLNDMRTGTIVPRTMNLFKMLSRELPVKADVVVRPTRLFAMRHEVDQANAAELERLPGEYKEYTAIDTAKDVFWRQKLDQNTIAPASLRLKLGAQVMLIKNLDMSLVNGSRGTVIGYQCLEEHGDEEWPTVTFENGRTQTLKPESWELDIPGEGEVARRTQVPLLLCWAMSIHKSQGQTIEKCIVDLGRIFEKGQAYVALSRATSIQGLQVLNFRPEKIMAHERVVEYYRRLQPEPRA